MANIPQELSKICRFCLCQNVKLLLPIVKTLHTMLTIEDIERFTGIHIDADNMSYAVCLECLNKLNISADFLSLCLSNDERFQMLHCMLVSEAEGEQNDLNEETGATDDDNCTMDYDSCDGPLSSKGHDRESLHSAKENRNIPNEEMVTDEAEHFYSANYIEPGETVVSDEEDSDPENYMNTELNPSYPRYYGAKTKIGKRKAHLCDVCAKWFVDITHHYFTHTAEPNFACPHCPTMTKQKNSLIQHIKTVHMKTITKTCEICGKGFIHHKTYRYHMRSHQSEGATFKCEICFKKFSHPSGFEQHIKKFHRVDNNSK